MKTLSILFFTMLLGACATTREPQIHYYYLNAGDTKNINAPVAGETAPEHDVEAVLAQYLAQPGILLQTGHNQLTAAHYHRWAEPLGDGILRYVKQRLSGIGNDAKAAGAFSKIRIEFFQFHGTKDGRALIAGNWAVYQDDHQRPVYFQEFNLSRHIETSGYDALVKTLAAQLKDVAREIAVFLTQSGS